VLGGYPEGSEGSRAMTVHSVSLPAGPGNPSVRVWGAVLFVLTFAEGALGVLSAGRGGAAPADLLAAHVVFGIGLVALSVWALWTAWRASSRPARFATAFTAAALASTAGAGAVVLLTGFAQGANIDRGLAILSLAGTVLMMILGSGRRAVVP
jgi:hypothetical protein